MQTRRTRRTIDQWSELVEQFDSSAHSMEEFCQLQNLAMSTFQRWRSMIHRSREIGNVDHSPDHTPGFTRVTHSPTTQSASPSAVTLQIGSSITVTIHSGETP